MRSATACPHCGSEFAKPPQRKQRCKACRQDVYPKRRPGEDSKRLYTREEADEIERQWSSIAESNMLIRELGNARITESEFRTERARMPAAYSDRDVAWSLLNDAAQRAMAKADWHWLKMAYYAQALHLDREGRSPFGCLLESHRAELRGMNASGVERVEILSSQGCEPCRLLNGTTLSIADALETMPLPCSDCETHLGSEHVFCRCCYIAHIEV